MHVEEPQITNREEFDSMKQIWSVRTKLRIEVQKYVNSSSILRLFLISILLVTCALGTATSDGDADDWLCYLHRHRVEITYRNSTDRHVRQAVVIPVREVADLAEGFPGKGVVVTSRDSESKMQVIPSQVDDLDQSGQPDDLAFEVELQPRQERSYFIYYDPEIDPAIPYPLKTYAAHQ